MPGALFNSASVPIRAKVSAKIKQKILPHEYIDFGILLNNTPDVQSYQLATENPMAVDVKISQELNLDRIAGLFVQPPFEGFLGYTFRLGAKESTR